MARDLYRVRLAASGVVILLMAVMLAGCGSGAPEPLERGAIAIGKMMAPIYMKRSMFFAAYPDGKPSQYIRFLFSDIGAAEMPPQEGDGEFSETQSGPGRMGGPPILPKNVILQPFKPQPDCEAYQLVLNPDDDKNVVIITGYLPTRKADGSMDPDPKPVLTREITLKKVTPDEMARQFYHSSIEMGASSQMSEDYAQTGR